jgi:hypothetical protein
MLSIHLVRRPQSAEQVDAQKQAWDILKEGTHRNMDKRENAVQALGLDGGLGGGEDGGRCARR